MSVRTNRVAGRLDRNAEYRAPGPAIKGFLETSFLDWPGQVASVLFLAGCNFRCPFCHNHGLVLNPSAFPDVPWNDISSKLSRFQGWIDGVVISGGEPTLSPGLVDLAREIKSMGLKVKLDTNGSRPEVLAELFQQGLLDHVAMDVKGPLDEVAYARAAGRPGFLESVRESLVLLAASGVPYTLRTTVVPILHTESDVLRLAGQIRHASMWRLQKYHPENALDPAFRDITPWTDEYFNEVTERAFREHRNAD